MTQRPSEAPSSQSSQLAAERSLDQLTILEEQIENLGLEGMDKLCQTLQGQSEETLTALLSKRFQERSVASVENKPLPEHKLLSEIFAKRELHKRIVDGLIESFKETPTKELEEQLKQITETPAIVFEKAMAVGKEEADGFAGIVKELATSPMVVYVDVITAKELALRKALAERKATAGEEVGLAAES